jgi:hypothetical protein
MCTWLQREMKTLYRHVSAKIFAPVAKFNDSNNWSLGKTHQWNQRGHESTIWSQKLVLQRRNS